jgi:hypothetical protein
MTDDRPSQAPDEAGPYRDQNDLMLGGFVDRHTFRFVRRYPHPVELVWSALTDPEQLTVWLWPCARFEPRLGGVGVFNPGKEITLRVTEFEPPRKLGLGGVIRFTVSVAEGGSELTVDLSRPPDGWSPMGLAGYHGWLGRLSRLLAGRPQTETDAWALGIWNAVIGHCEEEVRRYVTGGDPALWRIHFPENEAGITDEAAAGLDRLAAVLSQGDLAVTIDGFGDDPGAPEGGAPLCAARVAAVTAYLRSRGQPAERIKVGFVLGNYHYLVDRSSEAGRAFNRRVELRPVY